MRHGFRGNSMETQIAVERKCERRLPKVWTENFGTTGGYWTAVVSWELMPGFTVMTFPRDAFVSTVDQR